jgi:hypothetical protein
LTFRDIKLVNCALGDKSDDVVETPRTICVSRKRLDEVTEFVDHCVVGGRVITSYAQELEILGEFLPPSVLTILTHLVRHPKLSKNICERCSKINT